MGSRVHRVRGVLMYVATIQLSQTTRVNVEAATLRTTRVDESDFKDHIGAMEEVRPKRGRGRAHRISLIRVHVGVDQRCRASDEESPAFVVLTVPCQP